MSKKLKLIIPIFLGLFISLFIIVISVFQIFDERISILENAKENYELYN